MESPTLLEAPELHMEWPKEDILALIPSPLASKTSSTNGDRRTVSTGPEEHDYFSFEDGNMTFCVENTLFTVHRYFFQRDSSIFLDMFTLPTEHTSSGKPQGTKKDPVHLPTLTRLDFERFLKILYPPRFGRDNLVSPEEWASALRVADMYLFDDIRQLAITELLLNCPGALRIQLGHRYKVRDLAFTGYKEICNRDESLRFEEIAMLNPMDTALIVEIRENWWKNGSRYNRYMGEARFSDDMIQDHFTDRLQSLP